MAPRLPVALVAGAVVCALLVACTDADPSQAGAPATRGQYISAVEGLMDPPGQLASAISERTRTDAAGPSRHRLDDLLETAEDRLAAFRLMRLDDQAVRTQRDRIAAAYGDMIAPMRSAAASLEAAPGTPVVAEVDPFLTSLRELPSVVSASSR